jgi:hypothetical protein
LAPPGTPLTSILYLSVLPAAAEIVAGAIQDTEIRSVGQPIVFGEIPGVIAHVGCANFPDGGRAIHDMCEEFAKRRFIIVLSGCAAMTVGSIKDEEGNQIDIIKAVNDISIPGNGNYSLIWDTSKDKVTTEKYIRIWPREWNIPMKRSILVCKPKPKVSP